MFHFVDQGWNCFHQPQNFGLLALTVDIKHKTASSFYRHKVAHWSDTKVNPLQLAVSRHLNTARVLPEKLHNFPLVSRVALFVHQFLLVWQTNCQSLNHKVK